MTTINGTTNDIIKTNPTTTFTQLNQIDKLKKIGMFFERVRTLLTI